MLTNLLQPLIEFYETRESREQLIIVLGIPIMLMLLFYLVAWEPIFQANEKLKNKHANEQRFTQWFNQQSALLSSDSQQFDWTTNSLPSVVESTLNKQGLSPWKKRIFQNQRQETVITFEEVPYNRLVRWIKQLNLEYQVVFRNLNMTAKDKLGVVDSKLTLAITHDAKASNSSAFK